MQLKKLKQILIIVSVLTLVGTFIYLGIQKDIWFCDEVYSYTSANARSFYNPIFQNSGVWISGAEVTQYLAANDRTLNFGEISQYLFTDHVPLYFWMLRIASVIAVGSCSKWVGLSLNMIFYIALFCCLTKFLNQNNVCSAVGMSMVCLLHPIILSEALTIRMYLMFTLAQVMLLLAVKEHDFTVKSYAKIGIAALFGLLTHFYFWIWLAFLSLFYIVYLFCKEKNDQRMKKIVYYMVTMLIALSAATVLFPNWFTNIFKNTTSKGHSSFQKIFTVGNLGMEIKQAIYTLVGYLVPHSNFAIPIVIFIIVAIIYGYQKNDKFMVWLSVLSSITYSVFVIHTQPSVEGRYLWSASVLILIAFLMMLREDLLFLISNIYTLNINRSRIMAGIMAALIIFDMSMAFRNDYKNIQYLRNRTKDEYQAIIRESKNPWIVFYDNTNWVFLCSMYDFTIPNQVKRVNTNEVGRYDKIIQDTAEVIVYTVDDSKSVEDCIEYIE